MHDFGMSCREVAFTKVNVECPDHHGTEHYRVFTKTQRQTILYVYGTDPRLAHLLYIVLLISYYHVHLE